MTSLEVKVPLFKDIIIDIDGADGNAYFILGFIKNLLKRLEYDKNEIDKVLEDMMSNNYEHLISVAAKYVVIKSELFDFEEII